VAEQVGLSQEERERAQRFESEDPKRQAALNFVRELVQNRGHVSADRIEAVREAGYTDEQVMEMVSNVALTTFSNYMNDALGTEVDIPAVEPVHSR
jgi:alkylhydroperoxidase family enzyme